MRAGEVIETDLFARLDRLPWSRFHVLVVAALGVSWILDGLEVTLAGSVSTALAESRVLHFSADDIGLVGSAYVVGAVLGALFFGWLTDRLGRRKLFFLTLGLYLAATLATAASWDVWSFALFRFLTGAGIGGEYAAINSAIQELLPARVRGWSDLVINGSFWIGGALGALAAILFLDPRLIDPETGWRLAFLVGAALGLVVFTLRTFLPESPRWLVTHGRLAEGEAIVADIESTIMAHGVASLPAPGATMRLRPNPVTPFGVVLRSLFVVHRRQALVGLALMAAQAFFYNAIFFTYALVLSRFYGVAPERVGLYLLPFAAANFMGPVLLGRFFDSWGRRPMIALTFTLAGLCLIAAGALFRGGLVSAEGQTIAWTVTFFFASAAASSGYLTVSETFPLEIRALAIAIFYALGTGLGGIAGPILFGRLIESGSRDRLFTGYLIASGLMLAAAAIHWRWGIAAERRSLEEVARPLSAVD